MDILGASLINAVLARPDSVAGHPCVGRFAVLPDIFCFQMMDETVVLELDFLSFIPHLSADVL